MIITRTITKLNEHLKKYRTNTSKIGFIPTMGALHKGHISLIECSKKHNQITVVSIFVNPTQFNNKEDLLKYPREEKKDLEKLKNATCDIVFIPTDKEMYPEKDNRKFNFKGKDNVMEGKYREGHFNGVAQIVSKLFEAVKPNNAYFGKKDFQQVAIIKYLNANYLQHLKINIIDCDILRENDGLAMSSRNQLLSKNHREASPLIHQTLIKYKNQHQNYSVNELIELIKKDINKNKFLEVEYIDIVNDNTLTTVDKIVEGSTTACIAVFADNVRLIDNVSF